MRLWKKILVIVAAAIVVLGVGGISLYKFVIIPKYIEPVLISASTVLKDTEVQDTIADIAEDLMEKGVIDENTLKNYLRKARKYTSGGVPSGIVGSAAPDEAFDEEAASGSRINTGSNSEDTVVKAQSAQSSLGVKTVRSGNGNDDSAKINQSYSKKFSSDNSAGIDLDTKEYTLGQSEDDINPEVQQAISSSRANSLYNKIINAMTMHERAVFFSVIGKADTDKLMTLYQTSDKAGAKEYLQSILDSEEYAEAVEIFFKYAPLLLE